MSRFFFMDPAPEDGEAMDKSDDAFRTISEVAEELQLPQHVLRFWETRFSQIRPLKRGGGRRYYRPDDVELLRAIRHLLYSDGYTIRGVHRLLKEKGVRAVVSMLPAGGPQPGPMAPARPEDYSVGEGRLLQDPPMTAPPMTALPMAAPPMTAVHITGPQQTPSLAAIDSPPSRVAAAPIDAPALAPSSVSVRGAVATGASAQQRFSTLTGGDLRKLHAALFELAECRRILSAAGA